MQINKGNFVVLSKIILSLEWFKLKSLRIWATLFTLIWPLCNGLKGIHTIYSIYKTHGYTQKQQVLFYLSTCCGSYKKAGSELSSPFSSNQPIIMEESKRTHQDTLRLNNIVNGNTVFLVYFCPIHLIFKVPLNIEIVVELWMFIYFLLFGWGKFNQSWFTYL